MALESLVPGSATVEEVFDAITAAGVTKADAAKLVGNWIVENAGVAPRLFDYRTDFPGTDPDCASQFVRGFAHQDWVDGEDVVQAQSTSGEDGFNVRFHRIEADLDAVGRDLATAFLCLAEQRTALRALLDEIRTEINLINTTIAALGSTGRPPLPVAAGGVQTSNFVGATTFFGRNVNVVETEHGTLLLPAVKGLIVSATDDPRVSRVADFARFLTDPRVLAFFGGGVSCSKFVAQFGKEQLQSGATIRDVLEIIPPEATFSKPQEMLNELAAREGAALRTSPGESDAIAASLGIEGGAPVAAAPVDRLETIPSPARIALLPAGIATIGDLAAADPVSLADTLRAAGVDVTTGDVAAWVGTAKILSVVR